MTDILEKAPDFKLPDQNDRKVSLRDFAGKWLVLYFYPKDDTPGCTKEACDFTDGLGDFEGFNATVIGVSGDDAESHRKFIAKYNLGLTLLSDPDRTVHKAYGAWGMKKNYGKEYEGTIRSTFIITPDGTIAASWHNVQVRSEVKGVEIKHADLVRQKLLELQGNEKHQSR
jgi:peroxiredoxin Q/BCP